MELSLQSKQFGSLAIKERRFFGIWQSVLKMMKGEKRTINHD